MLVFLALPVLTRYLTTEDFGIFNYTTSVMSFILVISTLSLNSFILRHYFEVHKKEEKQELFGTIFVFILTLNLVFLFIGFMIFPLAIKAFDIKIPFHPYFQIALVINFLEAMAVLPLVYYRVTKNAWRYFLLMSSKAILTVIVSLVLVIEYEMGIMGRYYGVLLNNLFFLVLYLVVMFKISTFSFNWSILKKGLRFSLPILPGAFAAVAILSIDRIILERYVSVSQLGVYSVGVALAAPVMVIVRGFYLAIEPEIYESFKNEGYNTWVVKLKDNFLYIILFLGCMLIIFCREIVAIMVPEQFYESYTIIPFFVVSSIFRGAGILICTTLYALNKTAYQPIIVATALLVNIVGNLILIPYMGILGAAVSTTLSFWVLLMMSVYITGQFVEIKWRSLRDTLIIVSFCGIATLIMMIQADTLLMTVLVKIVVTAPFIYYVYYKFHKT